MTKNKQKLINTILKESQIHHNISISFNKIDETDEIDNELLDSIIWQISEMMIDDFKMNWESEHPELGEIWQCGRSGATLYWEEYWKESSFQYDEDDLVEHNIESLKIMLKNIHDFNKVVEGLMENFYLCVNDKIKDAITEKNQQDKEDKLYNKTLKVIQKHNFTKRLFYDLIYKEL